MLQAVRPNLANANESKASAGKARFRLFVLSGKRKINFIVGRISSNAFARVEAGSRLNSLDRDHYWDLFGISPLASAGLPFKFNKNEETI